MFYIFNSLIWGIDRRDPAIKMILYLHILIVLKFISVALVW